MYQVKDTIAAGGRRVTIKPASNNATKKKMPTCVVIMSGARFPRVDSTYPLDTLDCCVKVEDTRPLSINATKDGTGERLRYGDYHRSSIYRSI